MIPDCRVAYRELGRSNAARTNTVLIPTWLLGRSDDWVGLLGANGIVDTTRYHVVVVDALGNGHSSSPSNTDARARGAFADLTLGDMVESQYRLLTERLGIRHLRAVVGFSMGGMQTIEWAVRYPDFMDRVVPIAGSPRVGAFDRLLWTAMLDEIEDARRAGTSADSVWARLAHLEMLFVQTPAGVNARGDSAAHDIAATARQYSQSWRLDDYAVQLRAIRRYDVTAGRGVDLRGAAARIRARVLAVYSWDDHMVTAGPVADFARMLPGADTLSVPSTCGHIVLFCEQARVGAAVRAFIGRGR